MGSGKLVVATVASQVPAKVWEEYEPLFRQLGVKKVVHLHVESREDAKSKEKLALLDGANAIFFTGGDQLKLTSQLGDSPIYERLREIYLKGGLVAGTSAGASVVCETMLVSGPGSESHTVGSSLRMAPGFGLIPDVIVDQHFEGSDRTLSVFGIRLHLLSMGDEFDLATRMPTNHPAEEVEEELVGAKDQALGSRQLLPAESREPRAESAHAPTRGSHSTSSPTFTPWTASARSAERSCTTSSSSRSRRLRTWPAPTMPTRRALSVSCAPGRCLTSLALS